MSSKKGLSTREVVSYIYKMVRPFRISLIVMFTVAIIWAIDLSVRPYILKIIIDRISNPGNLDILEYVKYPALAYFLLTLLYPTNFRFFDYFVEIKMVPNLRRNIAALSFDSLLKQSYSYYQNNFAGSLTNKINDLTNSVPLVIEAIFWAMLPNLLALIIAIFTLWNVNPIFALVMIVWSVISIFVSVFLSKKLSVLADHWSETASTITGRIVDSLSNMLSIRLFARDKEERKFLSLTLDDAVFAEQKLRWGFFWMWIYTGYSFVIVQGISMYVLIIGKKNGWITTGDFIVVLGINFAIVDLMRSLTKELAHLSKNWGKTTQALRAVLAAPTIQDKPDAENLIISKGRIVFDNVQFHYRGTKALFKNQSVSIEPGQKVGLVGYSGSGKTTFINLILRLYDIESGSILIDGQDIRHITQESLRKAIATIPQDPSLFHRSIKDNIKLGFEYASDLEIVEASKLAHAHEFISALPEGYDTLAGERGVKLSGGQRQRIAIARAILKNAPILIMDEGTSQLDSITEEYIQESLNKLMHGKTTLVIAHRLSTLLTMDRILVFEKGKIVQDGTHKELASKNGLYKSLWQAQIGGFLPETKS